MAVSDIYELTLTGSYLGQLTNNVFYFQQKSPLLAPPTSFAMEALLDAFTATFQSVIQDVLSVSATFTMLSVRNIFNPAENAQRIIAWAGTQTTAEGLPSHDAIAFRLGAPSGVPRDGGKRFAGVVETAQNGGVISGTGYIANLNLIADAMETVLSETISLVTYSFDPVIVKRVIEVVNAKRTYRLPENLTETVLKVVTNAAVSLLISTQTSRKIGRGR